MSGEVQGVNVKLYKGLYSTDAGVSLVELIGQGDCSVEHGGENVAISNKSTGFWVQYGDGMTTEKSMTITMDIHHTDDANYATLKTEAFNGTAADYTLKFADDFYYEGNFIPRISGETGTKTEAVVGSFTFSSNGEITRGTITP